MKDEIENIDDLSLGEEYDYGCSDDELRPPEFDITIVEDDPFDEIYFHNDMSDALLGEGDENDEDIFADDLFDDTVPVTTLTSDTEAPPSASAPTGIKKEEIDPVFADIFADDDLTSPASEQASTEPDTVTVSESINIQKGQRNPVETPPNVALFHIGKKTKKTKRPKKQKKQKKNTKAFAAGSIEKRNDFVYDASKSHRFGRNKNSEMDQFHDFRVEEMKKRSNVKMKSLPSFTDLALKSGGKAGNVILAKVVNVEASTKPKDRFRLVRKSRVVYENDVDAISKRFAPSHIRAGIIYAICLAILLWAGLQMIQYFQETSSAQDDFQEVITEYTVEEPIAVEQQTPDLSSWPPIVDFAALKANNPDVSGWIRIPGTSVDYPVLTNPEVDYYLHHDMNGRKTISGSIFADHQNSADLSQDNHIVIYGHHMVTKTMFHDVASYANKDFFDSHRVVYLVTPDTTYVLRTVAMYTVAPEEYDTRKVIFANSQDFQTYLDARVEKRSDNILYDDWDRDTADKFVTLITCNNSGSARQIVECVVEQEYPTFMIPNVIDRALADNAAATN